MAKLAIIQKSESPFEVEFQLTCGGTELARIVASLRRIGGLGESPEANDFTILATEIQSDLDRISEQAAS